MASDAYDKYGRGNGGNGGNDQGTEAATAAIMRSAAARPNTHRGGDAGRIVPVYAYFGNAAGSENNADVAAKLAMTTAIVHKHIATLYASAKTTGLLVASFTTGVASLALGGARLPQPNCFSHQQRQLTVSALAQVRHVLRRRRRFIARCERALSAPHAVSGARRR